MTEVDKAMTSRVLLHGAAAVWIVALCGALTVSGRAAAPNVGTDAQREAGKKLYLKNCSQCHGDKGDGEGYAALHLRPKPRNFTSGKFKIRTTPSGALPTHQDLVNIIRRGMPYTSMPAWPNFSDEEVSDLAYFITTFSPDFSNPEKVPQPVSLPAAPNATKDTIAQGKKLFEDNGCIKCHGTLGRADGPSAPTLADDWGRPIRPADLTQSWTFRGGATREDIFRAITTGLNGTPMPAFGEALQPDQRWAIVDYIDSLSGGGAGPRYTNIVLVKHLQDTIDLGKGAANFESASAVRFPIIGQITEPVRNFHPPTTSVMVQAVYDADSIAILVRWHDIRADKEGKNSPTMAVPPEEESEDFSAASAQAAQAPAAADNPFAEAPAATTAPPSEFSDAIAIQIPSQAPTGNRKPYFIFGDGQNSVDLWFYDLAKPQPQQFVGKGSQDVTLNDSGDITGVANFDQGEWSVIFKRPLRPSSGATLAPGEFMPIAFSVWDGFARERGSRRGLSQWFSLYMEPEDVPSAVGPMLKTALFIFAIEIIVIMWVRRRKTPRPSRTLETAGASGDLHV
jgi:cytochrome c oxidase cbb3-type subunit 2